jgi:hypothetical protein
MGNIQHVMENKIDLRNTINTLKLGIAEETKKIFHTCTQKRGEIPI